MTNMIAIPKWFAGVFAVVFVANTVGIAAWLSHMEGRVDKNTRDITEGVAALNSIDAKLEILTGLISNSSKGP